MVELLPCPFCGGKARLAPVSDEILGAQTGWAVECHDHTSISTRHECATFVRGFSEDDKAEAIKGWNTRAALKEEEHG